MDEKKEQRLASYKRIEAANLMAQADIDQLKDVSLWMKNVPCWLNDAEKEINALSNGVEQKQPMIDLIKTARKTHHNNESMLTMRFIKEIQENWGNAMHDKEIPVRLNMIKGRKKSGKTRKEQLEEQGNNTKDEVLKIYQSITPTRSTASLIARKLHITSTRVRQILKDEKKNKNDVR